MYKAVINDNYLCHYNKNHSPKNGQFTSGDGDGDGISNDHAHRGKKEKRQLTSEEIKKRNRKRALIGIGAGLIGTAAAAASVVVTSNHIKKGRDTTIRNYSQMMYDGWVNSPSDGRSFCTWLEDVKFIPELFDMNSIKF